MIGAECLLEDLDVEIPDKLRKISLAFAETRLARARAMMATAPDSTRAACALNVENCRAQCRELAAYFGALHLVELAEVMR